MLISITLTDAQIKAFKEMGHRRNRSNIAQGRSLEPSRTDNGFDRHAQGAIAEGAFALQLGVPYNPQLGKTDTNTGDVNGFQIKSITKPHLSLIVRPQDPPNFIYVLAYLHLPKVSFLGWRPGHRCKLPFWFKEPPQVPEPAHFVPSCVLNPMHTLPNHGLITPTP